MRPPGLNDQRSPLSRGPSGLPRSGKSGENGRLRAYSALRSCIGEATCGAVPSTYDQVATFLRRKIESTFEVEAYEPGRMIRASSTASSFPITFTRMVEPPESGTKVIAIITGDASGFLKLAEPILRMMVQRSVDGDYRNLREVLAPGSAE